MARGGTGLAQTQVDKIRFSPLHPPASVPDLALLLKIDLAMGKEAEHLHRLQCALDDAFAQGAARKQDRTPA